jgi:2-haloacid dehalogenase
MSNRFLSRREALRAAALAVVGAAMMPGDTMPSFPSSSLRSSQPAEESLKALVFDVFGTVVDWRTSISREVEELAKQKGLRLDGARFADAWRAGYEPSMDRVRTGQIPWTKLDRLHRMILDQVLADFGVKELTDAEKDSLTRAWHRLKPWPDVVRGLTRLKRQFIIAPLSNGNVSLMTDLAKHAGLPWDCVLGAELVQHYKPDPEVYQSVATFLDVRPGEVMMVAAHLGDLRAAKAVGLRTAFVVRPLEFGPTGKPDLVANQYVDLSAKNFLDLATQVGA